jgi:hypothetical protein
MLRVVEMRRQMLGAVLEFLKLYCEFMSLFLELKFFAVLVLQPGLETRRSDTRVISRR